MTRLIDTPSALRQKAREWHTKGECVALVPTMGALHAGHMSLVETMKRQGCRTIVSIFVNPAQFGPGEDLEAYPRTIEDDIAKLRSVKVDVVYTPNAEDIYPAGFASSIDVGAIARRWEGEARPDHFAGVATVVMKLLQQSDADRAIFGEKDFQQLAVIRQMARDFDLNCTILAGETVREADGLAYSSRNRYLNTEDRKTAGQLNKIMRQAIEAFTASGDATRCEDEAIKALLSIGFESVDYFSFVDSVTLEPIASAPDIAKPCRLITAARIGGVRLLDNMAVGR